MATDVTAQFLPYAANAGAAYDTNNSATAAVVNGWRPIEVTRFHATSSDFAAQLYTDSAGHYRIGMRGSELSNFAGDFRRADAALAAGQWDPQLTDAIRFVGEAILQIKNSAAGKDLSLDDIRAAIDGSGHSLGGSLWELASKFYGLSGMNIDGPGIARQIQLGEFASLKEEFRAKGLGELQDNYDLSPGQFQARRYTTVGAAQDHSGDVDVYTNPKLQVQLSEMDSTPSWAYPLGAGYKFAWEAVGNIVGHPMGAIYKAEGYADPMHALAQQNVASGLSANGYAEGSAHLINAGNAITEGVGANAEQRQPVIQITTYKDPITGAMMEARLGGNLVRGTFVATPGQNFVSGMDVAGRVVYTGDVAQSALKGLGADVVQVMGSDTRMSVQTHADGHQSAEFKNDKGTTAYLLPAEQGSGKQLVVTNPEGLPSGIGTAILQFDDQFKQTGATYLDKQGVDITEEIGKLFEIFSAAGQAAGPGIQIADAGDGIMTDGGLVTGYAETSAPNSTPAQSHGVPVATDSIADAAALAQATQSAALLNTLVGLQHWASLSDVQRLSALTSLYNVADNLNKGTLPGDLGGAASALGLISSLQSGNAGGALVSSVSLANALADDIASKAIGSALGMNAVNVIPGLNLALALESGNSVSMVAAAANFIPVYGPLISVGISLLGSAGLFGEVHKPPPPQGETHFAWGEDGSTTVVVDSSVTGGGQIAAGVASNVQHMLDQMVDSINAQTLQDHPDTPASQLLAINPNLLPAIGYGLNDAGQGSGWLHVVQPDGSISGEPMEPATLAQHLLKILSDNGGLAPQWMVDTQYQRYQHLVQNGASQEDIQRELHAGQGGHAAAGNQAYALQGNAAESADFHEQSFGALVAHVSNPAVQQSVQTLEETLEQAQVQTSQVLRDVEGDGYLERTEWVAASDSAGNTQGALVIDFNGNALIETRDILNLGGNTAEAGNQTDEANGARQNADLQRNNVQWLDANGDGVLDKSDPAFAAIKLWVDVNQDGQMQVGEGQTLSSLRMAAIDFTSGQIVYEDGHRDVLTAATLKADTEGVRATQIQEVVLGEDGVARTRAIDAGEVLEHEGYQGQVQVTDDGGTRWGAVREATFEQQAKRTGDWEGTAEQEQHRHGGGNAEGRPTETSATGATSLEEVKAQATLVAQSTLRPGDGRIAFVPLAQAAAQSEMRVITAAMIQSAQGTLFGTEGLAGLGALTAIALGTVQTAAQAGSQGISASEIDGAILVDAGLAPADGGSNSAYDTLPASTSVKASTLAADSSSGYTVALAQVTPSYVQTSAYHPSAVSDTAAQSAAVPAITATVIIDGLRTAQRTVPSAVASTSSEPSSLVSTQSAGIATAASEGGVVSLDYPVVQGETLAGFEDVVLRLSSALLANDSTINACADPSQPALRVTAVAQSSHGRVSLETRTDAAGHALTEVVFVPELNYHGTAGFDYTVTDQYGLSRTARATLEIAAVNDAPVGVGEIIRSVEDQPLLIQAGALLQNDSDVDNTHADLRIARVQSGAGGTVVLDANGDVVFTPSADYNEVANSPATFTYWVSDPAGGESQPVTASVLMSAVNDAPVALGEVVSGASEDAVFHVDKSILLGNDSDVDDPASALGIAWVGSATGGTVSLDASGNVVFTPTANFNGNATFQYRVRDAAGLESSTVQAVIPVALVNDTPVAVDDQFTTYRNSTMTVAFNQLTGNDTDVDVDALTVSAVRDHAHGTVSIVNGQVQFVPEANFKGQASFDYQADDGHGGQTWATAYVDVKLPPNLYPTIQLSPGATSSVWYGGSAYYNPVEVWQNFSYSLSDESPGSVSMSIVSVIGDLSAAPSASNSFQYHVYDGWGADGVPMQFNILLTDQEGIVNTAHVYVGYDLGALSHPMNGFSVTHDHTGLFVSPVLLDLMGDGLTYQAVSQSVVRYDMNADGVADQIAWVDNKDGVLVWDKDHNGQVSDVSEFSFQALKAGAQTDLEGLQALDTNHNGKLDANDEKFAEFGVWQDANGNGVTDADEFKTLEAWGIAQIDLKSNGQMYNAGTPLTGSTTGETDVTVMGEASFTRIDGSTGMVADAMLAYRPGETAMSVVHVSAASSAATESAASDAYDAEMTRMALLFNQMINTAQASDAEPLGFVPIQVDVHAQEVLLPLQEASLQQLQAA